MKTTTTITFNDKTTKAFEVQDVDSIDGASSFYNDLRDSGEDIENFCAHILYNQKFEDLHIYTQKALDMVISTPEIPPRIPGFYTVPISNEPTEDGVFMLGYIPESAYIDQKTFNKLSSFIVNYIQADNKGLQYEVPISVLKQYQRFNPAIFVELLKENNLNPECIRQFDMYINTHYFKFTTICNKYTDSLFEKLSLELVDMICAYLKLEDVDSSYEISSDQFLGDIIEFGITDSV